MVEPEPWVIPTPLRVVAPEVDVMLRLPRTRGPMPVERSTDVADTFPLKTIPAVCPEACTAKLLPISNCARVLIMFELLVKLKDPQEATPRTLTLITPPLPVF